MKATSSGPGTSMPKTGPLSLSCSIPEAASRLGLESAEELAARIGDATVVDLDEISTGISEATPIAPVDVVEVLFVGR